MKIVIYSDRIEGNIDNLTKEEEITLEHLLDIFVAIKQQILLRKVIVNEIYN